jgi:predicted CXXCH cytochrome family protein
MRDHRKRRKTTMRARLAVLLALPLLAAACGEDRIVFRERQLLENLPANAGGYVGYSDTTTNLTVCGNCHVTQHNQWRETAHATAFSAAANAAPQIADVCASCHAVSEVGNDNEAGGGGFPATRSARYHDVQCESCHGPGEAHVRNPDNATAAAMLARINAGPDMNGTCAECHSGAHHPYVEEWEVSGHGTAVATAAARPECQGCHEGKAALAAMGALTEYQEKGTTTTLAITCAVCHDPHRNDNGGQLRHAINIPNEEQNLCMRCHHKRGGPDPTGNRGPHSPEGPMLLGEAGWWPPAMPIEPGTLIIGTHGSEANPRMCAGCHMQKINATDDVTGQLVIPTTGHLFEAIPCLDASGLPTRDDCAINQRTFRTCTNAGCHGSENAARSAMITARSRIDAWNAQLKSQLARVPAGEINPSDTRYTTAEGATFNSQLADRSGSVVHNPFLLEALLIGSIQQIETEYNVAPRGNSDLTAALQRVLHAARLMDAQARTEVRRRN